MARLIQEKVKQPLAEELLFGKLAQGGEVHVSTKDEDGKPVLAFELTPAPPKVVKRRKRKAKKVDPAPKASAPKTPEQKTGDTQSGDDKKG